MPLSEKFENSAEFKPIITIALKSESVAPSNHFTNHVMSGLPEHAPSIVQQFFPTWIEIQKKINLKSWIEVSDHRECSICFFLAGFFYLILGLFLMSGLSAITDHSSISRWLLLQPQIALVISFSLMLFGIIVLRESLAAIKIARLGIISFIGFSIINSVSIQCSPGNPFHSVGLISFTICSISIGIFLGAMIQKFFRKKNRQFISARKQEFS